MARIYSNENFPFPVVETLRALGHDVLTVREAGKADKSVADVQVLAFAAGEKRAVLTLNRLHFIRLHRLQPNHAGIIVRTFDPDFRGQGGRIHAAICANEPLDGLLIRVNRGHL
jgi:Domain of unknown function (DUF5615)